MDADGIWLGNGDHVEEVVILPKALVERVLVARIEVRRIQADFDNFDGDRRGIAHALYEAKQELSSALDALTAALEKNDENRD